MVQGGEFLFPGFVGVEHNIVAATVGWPEADRRLGGNAFLVDHLLKDFLTVLKQRSGGFTALWIIENGGVLAGHIPRDKEGRPVDVVHQLLQIIGFKGPYTGEGWLRRLVVVELDFRGAGSGLLQ